MLKNVKKVFNIKALHHQVVMVQRLDFLERLNFFHFRNHNLKKKQKKNKFHSSGLVSTALVENYYWSKESLVSVTPVGNYYWSKEGSVSVSPVENYY